MGLWILGAAAGCFVAGLNVGLVAPGLIDACSTSPSGGDTKYLADLVADYGLTAQQERSVKLVLERGHEEETELRLSAPLSTLPPPIQKAVLEARGRMENRIRAVLDAEQRERYDRESRPK